MPATLPAEKSVPTEDTVVAVGEVRHEAGPDGQSLTALEWFDLNLDRVEIEGPAFTCDNTAGML